MVALENRLGWPGEGRALPSLLTAPPRCGRQNANTKLFLQLLIKFGDIVRVKTSCTIFDKDHDTAEEGRSRSLPEVKFLQPSIGVRYDC
jgi:hypothetical protein